MKVDLPTVALALCDSALDEVKRLRRVARVNRFLAPGAFLIEHMGEIGLAILLVLLLGPGLALWWFLDAPFLPAVIGSATLALILWGIHSYLGYDRYGIDLEMRDQMFSQLEHLNGLLPDLEPQGLHILPFEVGNSIDSLEQQLSALTSRLRQVHAPVTAQ